MGKSDADGRAFLLNALDKLPQTLQMLLLGDAKLGLVHASLTSNVGRFHENRPDALTCQRGVAANERRSHRAVGVSLILHRWRGHDPVWRRNTKNFHWSKHGGELHGGKGGQIRCF